MEKKKSDLELQADIYLGTGMQIRVLQPTVVNVDNVPAPSENVATKRTPDLCCGIYQDDDYLLPDIKEEKIDSFDFDHSREDGK